MTGGPTIRMRNFIYPLFHQRARALAGGNYAFYNDRVTDSLIMVRAAPWINRRARRLYAESTSASLTQRRGSTSGCR